MNNRKSLVIAIAAALIVAAAAVFAYFHFYKSDAAQPAVDTSSWKTYANKRFGYSMKYPADLSISANDPSLFSASFPDSYFSSRMKDYDSVALSVATSCDPGILLDWSDTRLSGPTQIGGRDFIRFYGYGVGAGNHQSENIYALPANGICYRIALTSRGANDAAIYGGTPGEIRAMSAAHAADTARIQAIGEAMLLSFRLASSTAATSTVR